MPSNVATVLLAWAVVAVDCLPVGKPVLSRGGVCRCLCRSVVVRFCPWIPSGSTHTLPLASLAPSVITLRGEVGLMVLALSAGGYPPLALSLPLGFPLYASF